MPFRRSYKITEFAILRQLDADRGDECSQIRPCYCRPAAKAAGELSKPVSLPVFKISDRPPYAGLSNHPDCLAWRDPDAVALPLFRPVSLPLPDFHRKNSNVTDNGLLVLHSPLAESTNLLFADSASHASFLISFYCRRLPGRAVFNGPTLWHRPAPLLSCGDQKDL